ncbi:MAG: Fe-S protein assembly co-chaperone HscB [Deltaproteobacteria bacterium]|nr:MAG: Fe-S protein assembly co-chaperone HscB [Deltaproteobacteria bacterium]
MSDHFALLGFEPRFAIDLDELERRYHERSRAAHPDRVAGAAAGQRVAALNESMALNEAYEVLRKPVPRAEYLLALHGVTIGDNEVLDPAFLADVLDAREELAAAIAAGDRARVNQLGADMQRRRDAAVAALGELWRRFDDTGDRAALDEIKRELIRLRYVDRYLEQVDAAQDDDDDEDD